MASNLTDLGAVDSRNAPESISVAKGDTTWRYAPTDSHDADTVARGDTAWSYAPTDSNDADTVAREEAV